MLSLTIWSIFALVSVPLFLHISNEFIQLDTEKEAVYLIYDKAYSYLLGEYGGAEEEVKVKGTTFKVFFDEHKSEVCVEYESRSKWKRKCETIIQQGIYDG